ncbi:MAG: OsmC family protein [Fimbriimonadaceae bacterium]
MKRSASAVWSGDLKSGNGQFSAISGAFDSLPYSFAKRFENEAGTNPEELIAAAHAACYSMALSAFLGNNGFLANTINTTAEVTLEPVDGAQTITRSHLTVVASVDNIEEARFKEIAAEAKEKCPVSRALNLEITLEASLG